uniref:F-box domain-containing protein n=1 Tax=Mycena chlorophos TaxID=658473 RepID=A0ABQ0LE71_MYCCL|nr:predicted protein [Mycena chlorophos]
MFLYDSFLAGRQSQPINMADNSPPDASSQLPPELLALIFTFTLPPTWAVRQRARLRISESPWYLTHVSSHWRAVAISTPSLWSRIAVTFMPGADASLAFPFPLLETQLKRASQLAVFFRGCESMLPARDENMDPQMKAFSLLLRYSNNWVEANLRVTSSLLGLLQQLQGRVSSLRRIWFRLDTPLMVLDNDPVDVFSDAPSLVDFGCLNQQRMTFLRFPKERLTRYSINGPMVWHRLVLTHAATTLVEAYVWVDFEPTWPELLLAQNQQVIHLPYLRRLFISFPRILHHIGTPALEELGVAFGDQPEPGVADCYDLRDILAGYLSPERSACPLRRLLIHNYPAPDPIMQILRTHTHITELGLMVNSPEGVIGLEVVLATLVVNTSPIAPHLKHLFVACENDTTFDYTLYERVISSRFRARDKGYALQSTALALEEGVVPGEVIQSLQRMEREGLVWSLFTEHDAGDAIVRWTYV